MFPSFGTLIAGRSIKRGEGVPGSILFRMVERRISTVKMVNPYINIGTGPAPLNKAAITANCAEQGITN